MSTWRLLRRAAMALVLAQIGCSGLSPEEPEPPGPDAGCGTIPVYTPLNGAVTSVGTDSTLDLATWNLEFFPLQLPGDFDCPHPNSPARIQAVANLINTLNLDVIGVQEISESGGFSELLALCPNYGGVLVPGSHGCNFQRTGVIYRKDVVTLNSSRVMSELSIFTRDPFEADLTASQSGRSYHFRLIVVHLKAGGTASDESRRRAETAALHDFLERRAIDEPEVNYVVAGDWNDVLTDPITASSFPALLNDPEDYTFVVDELKTRSDLPSQGNRLIDLIMVNRSACPEFTGAQVTTLRLDQVVPGYSALVSDHRPVMVSTPVFN